MDLKRSHIRLFLIIAIIGIALLIVKPYIMPLTMGAIFAYLLWPIHKKIRKKTSDFFSALFLTSTSVIITAITSYYAIILLLEEAANFYLLISKLNMSFGGGAQDFGRMIVTKVIESLSSQIATFANLLISFTIFLVSLFYFLKEGQHIYENISKFLPFEKKQREKIVKNISDYLDAFVHVQLVIAIFEGVLAAIGFWILGLPYPVLAGLAAGVLSIIPGLGPSMLYFPASILVYESHGLTISAILILYGLIFGTIMDYIARPIIYGKRVRLHPLLIFIGLFGGIKIFGFLGIIIGPIILSIGIALFKELNIEN